jgi:hypothetical protein
MSEDEILSVLKNIQKKTNQIGPRILLSAKEV